MNNYRNRGRTERRSRYYPRRRACSFCIDKVKEIDYKDVGRLRRFLSDRAKIESRRKTGTCARHQRVLSVALKRARYLALLPYTHEHIRLSGGPAFGRHPRPSYRDTQAPRVSVVSTPPAVEVESGEVEEAVAEVTESGEVEEKESATDMSEKS